MYVLWCTMGMRVVQFQIPKGVGGHSLAMGDLLWWPILCNWDSAGIYTCTVSFCLISLIVVCDI